MQRVNEYDFYKLAERLVPLKRLSKDVEYAEAFLDFYNARISVEALIKNLPLVVSRHAGQALVAAITSCVPADFGEAIKKGVQTDPKKPPMIWSWQISGIASAINSFETILAAECQVLDTYLILKTGAYSTADLVERAHIVFGDDASKLTAECRADFDQAGRSLAFMLPTAAAFHTLRGTEAVIRNYYQAVVGSVPKKIPRNWAAYISLLERNGADKDILAFIDHVRTGYRNPILHPDETVDASQASILFGACISLVTLILREMDRLRGGAQLALPNP
jgi:hypothetical protein